MEATDAAWKRVACKIEGKVSLNSIPPVIKSHTWSWSYSSWRSINEHKSGSSTSGSKPSSRDRCSRPFKGNIDRVLLRNHNCFVGLAWVSWSKNQKKKNHWWRKRVLLWRDRTVATLFVQEIRLRMVGMKEEGEMFQTFCCPTKLSPESWLDVRMACPWRCRTGLSPRQSGPNRDNQK